MVLLRLSSLRGPPTDSLFILFVRGTIFLDQIRATNNRAGDKGLSTDGFDGNFSQTEKDLPRIFLSFPLVQTCNKTGSGSIDSNNGYLGEIKRREIAVDLSPR